MTSFGHCTYAREILSKKASDEIFFNDKLILLYHGYSNNCD